MEAYQNLTKVVASHYRGFGDKIVLQILQIGKNQYTGNELADEVEAQTEFGQKLINNLVLLALDLVSRGKETLVNEKPVPPPSRRLKEGEEPNPLR
jgi:hypothetical protein